MIHVFFPGSSRLLRGLRGSYPRRFWSPDGLPDEVAAEIGAEQAHVDRVYARVEEAAASAGRVATDGHLRAQSARLGLIRDEDATGLFERDVLVFTAARRIAELEAEHEGLVFHGSTRRRHRAPPWRSCTSAGSVSATPSTSRW